MSWVKAAALRIKGIAIKLGKNKKLWTNVLKYGGYTTAGIGIYNIIQDAVDAGRSPEEIAEDLKEAYSEEVIELALAKTEENIKKADAAGELKGDNTLMIVGISGGAILVILILYLVFKKKKR